MDDRIEVRLIEEAKHNVVQRTTSLGEQTSKLSVDRYVDKTRFSDEIDRVFSRLPSAVLHSTALQSNNSYEAVNSPLGALIVSRDEQGKAHVFFNSCRHRGARLVEGQGNSKHIVCPYHAWSYGTDGELKMVPGNAQCFPELDKSENGLVAIPSVEKYGFIWICPSASRLNSTEDALEQHLGGMKDHLEWMGGQHLKVFKQRTKRWRGNWKLFAEGGLETYHFAFAHKATIAQSFYNNIAVIDEIDSHFRVVMPTRELQKGNPSSLHDCSHTLFFLLPNSALLVQKAHVDWIHFQPISANETDITVTTLIPNSAELDDPKQLQHWQRNHTITNATLDEDWALGESIQASLEDRALPFIQYGKNEWALGRFNEVLDSLLAAEK